MILRLPWPPTVNTYWRRVGARTLLSRSGRAYKRLVSEIAFVERWPDLGADRLAVSIVLHAPDRRRYDLDNRPKAILDALQGAGLFADDEQVDELTIRRGTVRPRDGVAVVTVERAVGRFAGDV